MPCTLTDSFGRTFRVFLSPAEIVMMRSLYSSIGFKSFSSGELAE